MNWMIRVLEPFVVLAQAESGTSGGIVSMLIGPLMMVVIFSALGVVVLSVSFLAIVKVLPFSLRKEIEEDQNTALAIVIAAIILGLSIIIAAAMIG